MRRVLGVQVQKLVASGPLKSLTEERCPRVNVLHKHRTGPPDVCTLRSHAYPSERSACALEFETH